MTGYYFFVPQLHHLVYGQQPPESSQSLRLKAAPVLGKKDAARMDTLGLGAPIPAARDEEAGDEGKGKKRGRKPPKDCAFTKGWREWEESLRACLARARASKLGRALPYEGRVFPKDVAQAVSRAMGAETPLEGELILDKARWDAVCALQGSELFNYKTIYAYFMKLLLLERQASFQAETGFSQYKALYSSILERWAASSTGEST